MLAAPAAAALPAGAVATIDGASITTREFDRWARISARGLGLKVVPKPPGYAKCVTRKRGRTKASRKRACAAEFTRVRDETMAFLISARWIQAEAAERSIVVTDEEVQAEFDRQRDASFRSDADYLDFKDETLLTDADIRYRVRISMLSDRVRDRALEESGATTDQGAALERFVAGYRAKWIARTTCAKRYRTKDCGATG